jgi:hypothetical protein
MANLLGEVVVHGRFPCYECPQSCYGGVMPLPSTLTFNELDGDEVAHVLEERFRQVLTRVPYLQRHLTLPRVRMTLNVKLEIWADQPSPETQIISDRLDVVTDQPAQEDPLEVFEAESVASAAPGPGGHPPDRIRDEHGLPIAVAGRGPRAAGAHIVTSDQYPTASPGAHPPVQGLEGREVEDLPGLKISRTGTGVIDGMPASANATIAKIDQGPAGLRSGRMDRDAWTFGRK